MAFAVPEISPAFVQEIKSPGFETISPSRMISLKVHDIDGAYHVRGLMKGRDVTAGKVISFKLAGI